MNPRNDPMLRDLAEYALRDHPDTKELHRRAKAVIDAHHNADLARFAYTYHEGDGDKEELQRSAHEVLAEPLHQMSSASRTLIGIYLLALGTAVLAVLPWAWSVASAIVATNAAPVGTSSFLGFEFTPSSPSALVGIVILCAVAGSVAVMALVFSSRAGRHTLEDRWEWWYLSRPISAAVLGVLAYMAIAAGFFASPTAEKPQLIVAAAIGGLAGLFTDQVLAKMRTIIGLTAFGSTANTDEKAPVSG